MTMTMTPRCPAPTEATRAVASFWLLGLLNNAPWVLMLAVATNISSGGVALVFLSNQIPGLVVKLTAPYWFHLASYRARLAAASMATAAACFLVGCGGMFRDEMAGGDDDASGRDPKDADGQRWGLALELLGVSFVSFSCNLGEASLLALAGRFDSVILPRISSSDDSYQEIPDTNKKESQRNDVDITFTEEYEPRGDNDGTDSERRVEKLMKQEEIPLRRSITAFSSGTGLAGIVGYGYKALFSELFGWGLSVTVWSAMLFALGYWIIYLKGLHDVEQKMQQDAPAQRVVAMSESMQRQSSHPPELPESSLLVKTGKSPVQDFRLNDNRNEPNSSLELVHAEAAHATMTQQSEPPQADSPASSRDLTAFERFKLVLSLWPYTIPLFTVYAAEYMLQAGVWSAIGFPVTSASARAQFYQYSNWTYQAGVFLSRSSGNLCTASIRILWLMPFLQLVNLYFFWMDSIHHFLYDYTLLLLCLFAGLLGGGVYVQGYSRVNADMPAEVKEFAIASVSVADSLGILLADVLSLFIQSCIYKENNLEGAVVDCPY